MKLVDEHGEGQGNPKEEVALDLKKTLGHCLALPNITTTSFKIFFLRLLRPYQVTRLVGKNGYP
jgi:hypothetical protein